MTGTDSKTTWTIVVAAGSGQRYGGAKQFDVVAGQRVVDRSVATALRHSDGVVVVVPADGHLADHEVAIHAALDPSGPHSVDAVAVVAGGPTRSASVRCGLAAVPANAGIIVVHDAARPAASDALFDGVIEAVTAGAQAAIPVIDLADTIRRRTGAAGLGGVADAMSGVNEGAVDRSGLCAVQTPQAFDAAALRRAHSSGAEATDDATLVERGGGSVVHVPGERSNIKITEPSDLEVVATNFGRPSPAAPSMKLRVGNGFDIHRFSDDPGRVLVLGGIVFDGARGLVGHSDADVVAHACCEALLGAVGLGDLGSHFPDTDDRWKGVDSMTLLARVVEMVAEQGMTPMNLDCSVIAESPKLAPRRVEMESALSAVVGAPVSVKGRRAEGIGGLGRGEGIAALVTALLVGSEH